MASKITSLTTPAAEDILLQEDGVTLFTGGEEPQSWGSGMMFLTTSAALWWSTEKCEGIQLPYKLVIVAAVSRDLDNFPQPCIYILTGGDSDDDEDMDDVAQGELRLVPSSHLKLDEIYQAFCKGMELNGDPPSDDEDMAALDGVAFDEDGQWEDIDEDVASGADDEAQAEVSAHVGGLAGNGANGDTDHGNNEGMFDDAD